MLTTREREALPGNDTCSVWPTSCYTLPLLLGRAGQSWPLPKRSTVWPTVLWVHGEFMLGIQWSYFTTSGLTDSTGTVLSAIFYLTLKKKITGSIRRWLLYAPHLGPAF